MFVIKRDGRREDVHFDKITSRIKKLSYGLSVEPVLVSQKVIAHLYNGVTTVELDTLAGEAAATMITKHPDYETLASRIAISNLQKETKKVFSEVVDDLYNWVNSENEKHTPLVDSKFYSIVQANADKLNSALVYDRDFEFSFYSFKTLEEFYLLKLNGKVVERPQHMFMRIAVGIHEHNIEDAIKAYNLMSEKFLLPNSAALHNAGLRNPQLNGCFSITMKSDSIEGIYDTLTQCAFVSKYSGNVGLNVHCIRSRGTFIAGTNGFSNGTLPMLRVFNSAAVYMDHGGRRRRANFTVYMEPWHADILDFLDAKKSRGKYENRARELMYALWVPDLFMRRVESAQQWSLMCPHECPGLQNVWGDQFDQLYERYEAEGRFKRRVSAQELWYKIVESQLECGCPLMFYKDSCNRKSNQQNVGTVMCSDYSGQCVLYSSPEEIASCSLASIALNRFVINGQFDFDKLHNVAKAATRLLNQVIDATFYPRAEAALSSKRHRPIGIGVQGLADVFVQMSLLYESDEACLLNKQIFETIYHGALMESCQLAAKYGPYETYHQSPASRGQLQYDLWNAQPTELWNWQELKGSISANGLRNSLLVALMPTLTTSQIFGNTPSVEAPQSMLYTKRLSSGEYPVINAYLTKELVRLNLWNEELLKKIVDENGSIASIEEIPESTRVLFRTTWEIPQKVLIKLASERAPFVDQSQSLVINMSNATTGKLTSMHFYCWKQGLKTGMRRLNTNATTYASLPNGKLESKKCKKKAWQHEMEKEKKTAVLSAAECQLTMGDQCVMCGS